MEIKLLLLLLILFSINSAAQENEKVFYGKLHDEIGPLANAHIINITSKSATYSSLDGSFKIFVKINDVVKFTSIGYKTDSLVISPMYLGINQTEITLLKEVYELDEVELKKHNLIGSLSSDIKHVKSQQFINAQTLKLPNADKRKFTVAERRLYTARTGTGIEFLINTISGRMKNLKTLKNIEDNEKEVNYLKNNFSTYIINDLKIDSLNLNRFIGYCQQNHDYNNSKKEGKFYLIEFLKQKAIEFKNND